jgi:hypothetical protein
MHGRMNGGSKLKTVTNNGLLASKALLGRKAGYCCRNSTSQTRLDHSVDKMTIASWYSQHLGHPTKIKSKIEVQPPGRQLD